jgi:flagellar biosynthesis protein FliQ
MTPDLVVHLVKEAVEVTLFLSLPILSIGLVVGLAVSLFQAVTQIQEMTLSFVPKIVAVMVGILLLLPWMMTKMTFYTEQLMANLPKYIR